MAQFLKISVLIVAFFLFVQVVQSQITFTGRVDKDFNGTSLGYPKNQTLVVVPDYRTVTVSKWMTNHSLISGWDIKAFAFQYDWLADTMHFGWDCWVICGDADGDGNPSASTDKGNVYTTTSPLSGQDKHIHADSEAMLMTFWTSTPNDYVPQNNNWTNFYPDVVVGNTYVYDGLLSFDAYEYSGQTGTEACDIEGYSHNSQQCINLRTSAATIPTATVERYRTSEKGGLRTGKSVLPIILYRFPNVTVPDIEFSLRQFSRYGQFSFRPGIDSFRFATGFFASSTVDNCGEEQTSPFIVSIPCTVRDACGVCGGNNSTCLDCAGVANGPKRYDHCGVCGGTNSTCLDCSGVANGPKKYDACGVCDGGNETCLDCSGIPNGVKDYDACGVCDGRNETCLDCSGVPNGPDEYDSCGVCAGDDSSCSDCAGFPGGSRVYDLCGVCDGDSSSCWDCAHVPNGPKRYDSCGVCGGTNSTCLDCAGVANGPLRYDHCGVCGGSNSTCLDCAGVANGPKRYDHCGVCGGTNSTCLDCAGVANGPLRYDHCGVCGGTNSTCLDCAHVANGPKRYDSCGVCGGTNSTCLDCAGVANGGKVYDNCGVCGGDSTTCVDCSGEVPINGFVKKYDECGVCDGDNSTCWDCAHIPNGPWVYDLCGVCGGHNEDCECYIYKNFTIIADDTYVSLEHRSQNFDKSVDLAVSSNKERTLLKFDDIRFSILGATEQKPVILSAKIRLFIRGVVKLPQQGWEDSKLVLHNLDNNFCAEKATWECRDYDETGCCTEWKMLALYPKIKADYEWEETASTDVVNFQRGWVEFDVKEDIEDFLKNSFLNSKSYLLKKGCEKDFGWIRFWSSESGGQINAPELAISIRARCGPEKVLPPADPCEDDK